MERELSASTTGFFKYAVLPIWLVGMGAFGIVTGFSPLRLALYVGVAAFLAVVCGRLKRVTLKDDTTLVVSGVSKTVEVPLDQVESVTLRHVNPRRVRLHLRGPSALGGDIEFLPRGDAFELLQARVERGGDA